MSKYVRTTDGRIVRLCGVIQESIHVNSEGKILYISDRHNPLCVYAIPYVKQADTIEELCDWYVSVWSKDGHTEYCTYYDLGRDLFQSLTCAKFTIYGAIWTDKGLIYVAKMNEKGEFELL